MKKNIHPKYFEDAKVICSCGNVFTTGSTTQEIKVELCSACHPFYTGKQNLVDAAGRVEKFHERAAKQSSLGERKGKKVKRAAKAKSKKEEKEEETDSKKTDKK
jgi:large subunit ribosomal protein L31